ncbi:hypothetical protein [Bauldia sp.]|uniref:hypothetical protein n=1 Tax=Bauldia sp. TaxID=2575872 RepID=UPI003BAA7FB3
MTPIDLAKGAGTPSAPVVISVFVFGGAVPGELLDGSFEPIFTDAAPCTSVGSSRFSPRTNCPFSQCSHRPNAFRDHEGKGLNQEYVDGSAQAGSGKCKGEDRRSAIPMDIAVLGIDLGKTACSLAGLDSDGVALLRRLSG